MPLQHVNDMMIALAKEDESPSSAIGHGLSLAKEARAHVFVQALSTKLMVPNPLFRDVEGPVAADGGAPRSRRFWRA